MARQQVCFSVRKEVGLHNTDLLLAALDSLPGVTSASVDKDACGIAVEFDSAQVSQKEIAEKIGILGYPIRQL